MKQQATFLMLAKTFKGLEEVLAQELIELGANDVQLERRAVSFRGDMALLYRANLCLRTASRILVPIVEATLTPKKKNIAPEDLLYEAVKRVEWSRYMSVENTFAIDATVYSDTFRNSRFVTYRVKDAIADYWMEHADKRPSVATEAPDILINVHIAKEHLTLSLDSSGESLHKRGYRVANTEAPINEALAAGMLLMAGWKGQSDFYDPMCGSGTLLIEAALIARNIAPGVFRQAFAFEKWPDFDAELWSDIYNDDSQEHEFTHKITVQMPLSMLSNRQQKISNPPVCRRISISGRFASRKSKILFPSLVRVKSSARSDCRWPSVELPRVGLPLW